MSGNDSVKLSATIGGSSNISDLSRETFEHFERLIELDEASRARALEALARSNSELHRRVRTLLAASEAAEARNFLSGPKISGDPPTSGDFHFHSGDEIDVYRLQRPIGRGGMGEVWLAYRTDGAYDAPVALKLLHAHLAAGTVRARFVREGRILASLSHPNIARMLDAGVTPTGQHFLVIEFVEGGQVDRWCDARVLDIEARIRLFLQICSAVSYAHAHLVVHRDLKPSNVLMTADGTVKLLDFGIAKLIEPERQEAESTQLTHLGGGLLTPDYAAPEQVLGKPVTTATDAYALGILLYRLLTGRRPYGDSGKTPAQLAFDVLQVIPRAPSEIVTRPAAGDTTADALAALRATTPRNLSRLLAGDLDAIVGKALRKESAERYADARAIADDLERFLSHQPVQARSGARSYIWRQFIRRNWLPLSVTAGLILILTAGVAGFAWQARQTQREAHRASDVTDFLIRMFRASDPRIAQDKPRGQITARELLDRSAGRITTEFAADPDTEIRLLGVAADIYRELDDEERYSELHRQQIELARRFYGDLHPAIIKGLLDDAASALDKNDAGNATLLLDQADALIRRAGMDHTVTRARWLVLRSEALSFTGDAPAQEQSLTHKAVSLYEAIAPKDPGHVTALADLGALDYESRNFTAAVTEYRGAVDLAATLPNRNDGELTVIYNNLALAYQNYGDLDAAETSYREAEDLVVHTYGKHHRNYWKLYADHAALVHDRGDRTRALSMFDEVTQLIPAGTPMSVEIAEVRYEYATSLTAEGQPLPAIPMLEECKSYYMKWPLNEFSVSRAGAALGDAYDRVGRTEDARRELKAALDGYVAANAYDSRGLREARERWGRFLMEQGDVIGAEQQFRKIVARSEVFSTQSEALARTDLAQLALRRGDAKTALRESSRAVTLSEHLTGFFDIRTGPRVWRVHAEALLATGDLQAAHAWIDKALAADRRYDDPQSRDIADAESALRAIELAQARPAK